MLARACTFYQPCLLHCLLSCVPKEHLLKIDLGRTLALPIQVHAVAAMLCLLPPLPDVLVGHYRVCTPFRPHHTCVGLAGTINIQWIYGNFCRDFIKYTGIYGVYIRFWPTLYMCICALHTIHDCINRLPSQNTSFQQTHLK